MGSVSVLSRSLFPFLSWQNFTALWRITSSSLGRSPWPPCVQLYFFQGVTSFSASLCCGDHSCPTPCQSCQLHFTLFFLAVYRTSEQKPKLLISSIFCQLIHSPRDRAEWKMLVLFCSAQNSNSFDSTQSEVRKGTGSFTFTAVTQRTGWLRTSAFLIDREPQR